MRLVKLAILLYAYDKFIIALNTEYVFFHCQKSCRKVLNYYLTRFVVNTLRCGKIFYQVYSYFFQTRYSVEWLEENTILQINIISNIHN